MARTNFDASGPIFTLTRCDGSLIHHAGNNQLYFSHPDPPAGLLRTRLRVWRSADLGVSWVQHATVWGMAAGYSALTVMGGRATAAATGTDADNNHGAAPLGVLYDRNNHSMLVFEAQSVSFTTIAA